jgi:hypothetical protein
MSFEQRTFEPISLFFFYGNLIGITICSQKNQCKESKKYSPPNDRRYFSEKSFSEKRAQ